MQGISGYGGDEDSELDEERARERGARKGVEGAGGADRERESSDREADLEETGERRINRAPESAVTPPTRHRVARRAYVHRASVMVSPGQTASYQEIWNNRAEIGTTAVEPPSRSRAA